MPEVNALYSFGVLRLGRAPEQSALASRGSAAACRPCFEWLSLKEPLCVCVCLPRDTLAKLPEMQFYVLWAHPLQLSSRGSSGATPGPAPVSRVILYFISFPVKQ